MNERNRCVEQFLGNCGKRSRTLRGLNETGVSPKKAKLLLSGDDLAARARRNLEAVGAQIFADAGIELTKESLLAMMGGWFDIMSEGLENSLAHAVEYQKLVRQGKQVGENFYLSERYRTWEVNYSPDAPAALYVGRAMQVYADKLAFKVGELRVSGDVEALARAMAWADRTMDQVIHPWRDGCGRMATALVMWLGCQRSPRQYPVFTTRDEHYAAMKEVSTFEQYYLRCLQT